MTDIHTKDTNAEEADKKAKESEKYTGDTRKTAAEAHVERAHEQTRKESTGM